MLPQVLETAGCLPASNATDGEAIQPGHLYVAPLDHHLLLEPSGHVRVTRGPKENRFCPAVDADSGETLLAEFTDRSEEGWWNAPRASEEIVLRMRRMAAHRSEHEHGEAALPLFEAHRADINLLMTDVVMPGQSGRGLAEARRRQGGENGIKSSCVRQVLQ